MNKILGFEPISDRMCKLRVKGKFYNMTVINMYVLQQKIKERKSESNFTRNHRALRIEYQNMT